MKSLTLDQQQRRERILGAAREQLSRFGYEGVNMRDLANIANVSTTTLYNLYQNKDTLILAALEEVLTDLLERIDAATTGQSGIERYIIARRMTGEQIIRTPRYSEAMARMLFTAEPSDPIVQLLLSDELNSFREALTEMVGAGEVVSGVDRDFVARAQVSQGWAVILMWVKGFVALHDFVDEYVRASISVLLPWMTQTAADKYRARLFPIELSESEMASHF